MHLQLFIENDAVSGSRIAFGPALVEIQTINGTKYLSCKIGSFETTDYMSDNARGFFQKVNNILQSLETRLQTIQSAIAQAEHQIAELEDRQNEASPYLSQITELQTKLNNIKKRMENETGKTITDDQELSADVEQDDQDQ